MIGFFNYYSLCGSLIQLPTRGCTNAWARYQKRDVKKVGNEMREEKAGLSFLKNNVAIHTPLHDYQSIMSQNLIFLDNRGMGKTVLLFPDVGIPDFRSSFFLCLCTNWRTALVTVVLMLWMKLTRSSCPEINSTSVVTILRHGSASKGIHPGALHKLWNSPSGKDVGDCPRNTLL